MNEKKKSLIRLVVLPILLILHITIGTFIFMKLEGDKETIRLEDLKKQRVHFLAHTRRMTGAHISQLTELISTGCSKDHDISESEAWGFWNAFAFSFTVISTIGYGVVAPHDSQGRSFCIIYALIGIPLMTFHLAVINMFFMQGINKLDKLVLHMYKICKISRHHKPCKFLARIGIISVAFAVFLLVHFSIFYLIQYIRDPDSVTSFFNSIYFAVITYGTIGFGDVTPQSMDYTQAMEVIRVLMFASTGLALVGLCFTLYREAADKNMKVITKKMSVLPQRISIVQRDFIGQLQRKAVTTKITGAAPNGRVWGVSLQQVIVSGKGEDTITKGSNTKGSNTGQSTVASQRSWSSVRTRTRDIRAMGSPGSDFVTSPLPEDPSVPAKAVDSVHPANSITEEEIEAAREGKCLGVGR